MTLKSASPNSTLQSFADVVIAFSEVQKEEDEKKPAINSSPDTSGNAGPAGNSKTEDGKKSNKGPSEEELELIAALERANKALEEEANAARAKKQEEELVAALERANQGTSG